MAMKNFVFKLALSVTMVLGILCISPSQTVTGASSESPSLENPKLTPENEEWGSVFVYEVTYRDAENNMPAMGYPKVYIDGNPKTMEKKDQTDNDATDGVIYRFYWATTTSDVGSHSFYFYVETLTGENVRAPENGAYQGPTVKKAYTSLSGAMQILELQEKKTAIFSGYLTTSENSGIEGENIVLVQVLSDENVAVGSAITDENGYYTMTLEPPNGRILVYRTQFFGDNYHEPAESEDMYGNTLDKSTGFGIYSIFLLAMVGGIIFLLSRGIPSSHSLMPMGIGFLSGLLLVFLGAGTLGVLAAGVITGYLLSRKTQEWSKHLRVGLITGLLFLLIGLIEVYYIFWSPELFYPLYSITQEELLGILFTGTFMSLLNYGLLVGGGAVLGGMLHKFLKPGGQKPSNDSGEATCSGVEQE
ncbi:MAG: hypothetical protein DRN83_02210 [Hadesarchaea archaeon]|nr:MAG: hypothetical protein DRN83_02210 [Hadesarchaea archaeon]